MVVPDSENQPANDEKVNGVPTNCSVWVMDEPDHDISGKTEIKEIVPGCNPVVTMKKIIDPNEASNPKG